jgi:hypothetical protein
MRSGPFQVTYRWAQNWIKRYEVDKDPDQLLEMKRGILDRQIRVHGVDGGPTANSRADVAKQLDRMDRHDEARLLWEQIVAAYHRNQGSDDLSTVHYEEWLAVNLIESGRVDEGRVLLEHVYNVRLAALGSEDEATEGVLRRLKSVEGDDRL